MRRTGISFYVDPNLYDRFRTKCEERLCKVSRIVEGYMRWELGEDLNLRTSRDISLQLIANMDDSKDKPERILLPGMFTEALRDERNTQDGIERLMELQLAAFRRWLLMDLEDVVTALLDPEFDVKKKGKLTKRDYLSALWHIYALAYRDLTLELMERPEKALPAIQALKNRAQEDLEAIFRATEID